MIEVPVVALVLWLVSAFVFGATVECRRNTREMKSLIDRVEEALAENERRAAGDA